MRLRGHQWLPLQIGAVLGGLISSGLPAEAQGESLNTNLESATHPMYVAVLRGEQQPQQNPNAPNQPAPPQPAPTRKPKYDIYVGPDAGVYLPTSAKTRGRFGSDWISYGIDIFPLSTPHSSGRFSPSLQILSQSDGDDSMFFGLIGVQYRQALVPGQSKKPQTPAPNPPPGNQPAPAQSAPPTVHDYIPYFGLSAYEVVGDLVAVEDNVHSGVRTGVAGAAFFGVQYRNRAYIEVRYLQTSVLKSFDLSGISIDIGYRFRITGY